MQTTTQTQHCNSLVASLYAYYRYCGEGPILSPFHNAYSGVNDAYDVQEVIQR